MNIQTLLPLISQVVGRDLTAEVNLFYRARAAIGASLNTEGQQFFVQNWPSVVTFMESEEGKIAIATFLSDWAESLRPKVPPVISPSSTEPEAA